MVALSGHPLFGLRMDIADRVRMCIDMGVATNVVVGVAVEVVSVMTVPYKTKPAGWVVQVGGRRCVRLSLSLEADRAHHADTFAHSHGHRHRHRHHDGAARQHCPGVWQRRDRPVNLVRRPRRRVPTAASLTSLAYLWQRGHQ